MVIYMYSNVKHSVPCHFCVMLSTYTVQYICDLQTTGQFWTHEGYLLYSAVECNLPPAVKKNENYISSKK